MPSQTLVDTSSVSPLNGAASQGSIQGVFFCIYKSYCLGLFFFFFHLSSMDLTGVVDGLQEVYKFLKLE